MLFGFSLIERCREMNAALIGRLFGLQNLLRCYFHLCAEESLANDGIGQTIRLRILLAADVRYGEFKRARQLLADPVEGRQIISCSDSGTDFPVLPVH